MLPRFVACLVELEMEHGPPFRTLRFVEQLQPGLRGSAVALAAVARHAGTDNVFPGGFAATVARDDVVEIEVLAVELMPAILAGVVIAFEDVVPRKFHFLLRHPIEKEKENDLGHANGEGDRADNISAFITARKAEPLVKRHRLERAAIGLDDLRVALVEKHEGALDAADVHRLPETIEHEDVVAQDRFHDPFQPRRPLGLWQVERVVFTLSHLLAKL